VQLLGEEVVEPNLLDGMQLAFKVIDVVLFVFQNVFEKSSRSIVAHFD